MVKLSTRWDYIHMYIRMYVHKHVLYTGGMMMMMMTASSWLVHAVKVVGK